MTTLYVGGEKPEARSDGLERASDETLAAAYSPTPSRGQYHRR